MMLEGQTELDGTGYSVRGVCSLLQVLLFLGVLFLSPPSSKST